MDVGTKVKLIRGCDAGRIGEVTGEREGWTLILVEGLIMLGPMAYQPDEFRKRGRFEEAGNKEAIRVSMGQVVQETDASPSEGEGVRMPKLDDGAADPDAGEQEGAHGLG